jgi:hypothetical protein
MIAQLTTPKFLYPGYEPDPNLVRSYNAEKRTTTIRTGSVLVIKAASVNGINPVRVIADFVISGYRYITN